MLPLIVGQFGVLFLAFVALLTSAAVMVYAERKVAAAVQQRLGPYRVGPKGALQPVADGSLAQFRPAVE